MTFCVILVVLMTIGFVSYTETKGERALAIFMGVLLTLSICAASFRAGEQGKAEALKATGWTEYTKTELYEMTEKQKDSLPKTSDLWTVTYWKRGE